MKKLLLILAILLLPVLGYSAEWYVSSLAGGGGDGTSGDPWTLAELLTKINDSTVANGDRCNVKADGTYAFGASSFLVTRDATALLPITIEGYTSSIGDGGVVDINAGAKQLGLDLGSYYIVKNINIYGAGAGAGLIICGNYQVWENIEAEVTSGSLPAIGCYNNNFINFINCKAKSPNS